MHPDLLHLAGLRAGARHPSERLRTDPDGCVRERGAADDGDVRAATGSFLAEVMVARGCRRFGVPKFHPFPSDADLGDEVHRRAEELSGTPDPRRRDGPGGVVARERREYVFVEMLTGERIEMYDVPS